MASQSEKSYGSKASRTNILEDSILRVTESTQKRVLTRRTFLQGPFTSGEGTSQDVRLPSSSQHCCLFALIGACGRAALFSASSPDEPAAPASPGAPAVGAALAAADAVEVGVGAADVSSSATSSNPRSLATTASRDFTFRARSAVASALSASAMVVVVVVVVVVVLPAVVPDESEGKDAFFLHALYSKGCRRRTHAKPDSQQVVGPVQLLPPHCAHLAAQVFDARGGRRLVLPQSSSSSSKARYSH